MRLLQFLHGIRFINAEYAETEMHFSLRFSVSANSTVYSFTKQSVSELTFRASLPIALWRTSKYLDRWTESVDSVLSGSNESCHDIPVGSV